jgi:hypothetical protein
VKAFSTEEMTYGMSAAASEEGLFIEMIMDLMAVCRVVESAKANVVEEFKLDEAADLCSTQLKY